MAQGNNQKNNSNNQNQAQPKGKPPKCGTCGKLHYGRSYCFPSRLRVGRCTNNYLGM